jgi:hypothetical protein
MNEMSMTVVTMIIVMIVVWSSSSMVAVMIPRRMLIIAAIVGHAWVTFGFAIVMARGDMAARTAVRVATACSLSAAATGVGASAATGVSASATASVFCNECQKTSTRMELMQSTARDGRPGR